MDLIKRGALVFVVVFAGAVLANHFVLGNTLSWLSGNKRIGDWREAKVRTNCFGATETPEADSLLPRQPYGAHRVDPNDYRRAREMTAALHCYLVTKGDAVCDPNNRAYIIDYVDRYYRKMADMLAIAARYGKDEIATAQRIWDSPRNQAIEAALTAHIRAGRLTKRDFGWSAPAALKTALDHHSNAPDTCPARTAALVVRGSA